MVDQDIYTTLSIFTAFTIGGSIMGLPDAVYSSGWLLSMFIFFLITLTYWEIYEVLIRSMRQMNNFTYAAVVKEFYGNWGWKSVAVTILSHCLLLICNYHLRIVQLVKFALEWMGAIRSEKFSDYHIYWLEFLILSFTSGPLFLFGVYTKLENLKSIPIYIICIWGYFLIVSITDISIGSADRIYPPLAASPKVILTALESLNAIHCIPIICANAAILKKAKIGMKISLGIIFALFSAVSLIGSNYHTGPIKGLSLVHFSIDDDNFHREINYPVLIGIFGEIISLSVSILLVLTPARISLKQLIANDVIYPNEDPHHIRITYILLFLTYAMSFLFILHQLSLQYMRAVVYLILCLCYPFFIYIMLDVPLLNKIAFGIWIWGIISVCIYDITIL